MSLQYMLDDIATLKICQFQTKNPVYDKKAITALIKNKILDSSKYKSLLCLFDTVFYGCTKIIDNKKSIKGVNLLDNTISKYIKSLSSLSSGQYGETLTFKFFDNDFVLKIGKTMDDNAETIREFYIGIKGINKLRCIIPNFVYTFGMFGCCSGESIPKGLKNNMYHLVLEKINGNNVAKLIPTMKPETWMNIFIQILIALEISQREIQFTHFDMHDQNVMVRDDFKDYEYTVPIDDFQYTIKTSHLATIIDFGLSSFNYNNINFGQKYFANYGMMDYIVQGYDMYKFMTYCLRTAYNSKNIALAQYIQNIYGFYQHNDPYNIYTTGEKGTEKAASEYCKLASFSRLATYTPLELLDWILLEYELPFIEVNNREIYTPICNISSMYMYNNLVQNNNSNINELVNLCINENNTNNITSYFMGMYIYRILVQMEHYTGNTTHSEKIYSYLKKNKESLILFDKLRLNKYKNISKDDHTDDIFDILLSIPINYKEYDIKVRLLQDVEKVSEFFYKMETFNNMYYLIKSIELEEEYSDWIYGFIESRQMNDYTMTNKKALRWYETIVSTI